MNYGMCMTYIWNIGSPPRIHKRMKNKERTHFKAHYQKELEDIKNNMDQMASILEQLYYLQWELQCIAL